MSLKFAFSMRNIARTMLLIEIDSKNAKTKCILTNIRVKESWEGIKVEHHEKLAFINDVRFFYLTHFIPWPGSSDGSLKKEAC